MMMPVAHSVPQQCLIERVPSAQEGYPEAVKSAAVEQPDGSSTQPKTPKQDARAASEEARAVGLGLH